MPLVEPSNAESMISTASMIDEVAASMPLWMLMSAAGGYMAGEAVGDSRRHRKCFEETNEDLRDQLQKAQASEEPLHKVLKQQRGVINDIHKQLVALAKAFNRAFPGYAATVSKGPQKPLL